MKRFFSSRALNVFKLTLDKWPYPTHTHNFYELILIDKGEGKHLLNKCVLPYNKGDVFLIGDEDYHAFEIEKKTVFLFIKFTEQIFKEKSKNDSSPFWTKKINSIQQLTNTIPKSIIKSTEDKKKIFVLAKVLYSEFQKENSSSKAFVLELFGALMLLLIRNVDQQQKQEMPIKRTELEHMKNISRFIRQNLHDGNKLKLTYLAKTFNRAPTYLSAYIKKNAGMGLKNMITATRLQTADQLLSQSSLTVSEIAYNVGFYDASHMSKMFKKHWNVSLKKLG